MTSNAFYFDAADPPAKRAILGAALALYAEKGIDATSVRDIGDLAGFTNPALFRHFSGKDDLALYLFEKIFRHFRSKLPEVDDRPFASQLRDTLAAYLDFFDEDLKAALYFQENLRRLWPRLPAGVRRRSLLKHFGLLLETGVAQGAVSARDDTRLLVTLIAGFLGQLARQLYFRELPGSALSRLDEVHGLILRSLAKTSRAEPREKSS